MKKYFLATFFLIAFTFMLEPARNLMSKFLLVEQPQYHQIQEGEWLSKIAIQYYGDASYWRELELINRAPNGNKVYPGENIMIPSYEAMREIRRTQRLSSVNDLIQTQERLIASGYRQERAPVSEPVEETESTVPAVSLVRNAVKNEEIATAIQFEEAEAIKRKAQEEAPLIVYEETPESDRFAEDTDFGQQTSKSSMFLYGGAAIVVLALGIFFYIRKKKSEDVEYYGDVQQLEEVKQDEKDFEVDIEKESDPGLHRQDYFSSGQDETELDMPRKEEKVNEKEFVS